VYGVGSNTYKQLGIKSNRVATNHPAKSDGLCHHRITYICGGAGSSFALSDSGVVYAVGRNDEAQLGLGHTSDQDTPQVIEELQGKHIIKISCHFSCHVLALTGIAQLISINQ
jgi:E3 ubiquitin-protein ligase HERC2